MTPAPQSALAPAPPIADELFQEIQEFRQRCDSLYHFNSKWDSVLNVVGIGVSLVIVACGVYRWSEAAAILGGVMTAIVSLQRAFPFTQRWQFYRLLRSQTENLLTEVKNGAVQPAQAIGILKSLRLDYAQQIPRGSSVRPESDPTDHGAPHTGDVPPSG
ncbi:MAG: hypothetical protein JO323_09075 [Acidobacteriia bacterium]|nr:hypothetical protein [Terriglobia bacterium]